jgi:hypothetical protein
VELVVLFEVVVLQAKEIPNTPSGGRRKKKQASGKKVVANLWPICQKCLQICFVANCCSKYAAARTTSGKQF